MSTPGLRDNSAVAFFDIDNTVLKGASGFHLARGLAQHKFLSSYEMAGFAWKQLKFALIGSENLDDFRKVTESALQIIQGHDITELREITEEVFDKYLEARLWPGTLALAQGHLDSGQRVWLISATPVEVASVIAERLGLTGGLGTTAQVIDGNYTGKLIGQPMHGQVKADAILEMAQRDGLDLSRCSAYSDSANDIPMLSLVGNPVAINPDKELLAHARAHGWQVQDYRNRNFALTLGVPAAALAGIAIGLAAGIGIGKHRSAT